MKKFIKSAAVLLLSAFILISCSDEGYEEARITAFSFARTRNSSVLSSTVNGVIDEESRAITVTLDSELYGNEELRKQLVPTVSLSGGTRQLTEAGEMDFSVSPVLISVSSKDETRVYSVNIRKSGSRIRKRDGILLFTEYYNCSSFVYKNENCQFLEISNLSETETLDLSDVYLNRHVWKNSERCRILDQSVPLTGVVLEPGKSLVIFSQRSSFFKDGTVSSGSLFKSDSHYNGIISFNGQDAYTLTCGAEVLDALGAGNGEGNGLNWGLAKQMQRKSGYRYTSYNETEWLTTEATNSRSDFNKTAGHAAVSINESTYKAYGKKTLTYFAFENISDFNKVDIDETKKAVTVNFYSNSVNYVLSPAVSSDGGAIKIVQNGRELRTKIVSGETKIDFTRTVRDPEYLKIRVYDEDNVSYEDYSVSTKVTTYNMSSSPAGTYEEVSAIADGDVVILVNPAHSLAVGSSSSGTSLKGISVFKDEPVGYENGMASFAVTVTEENNKTYYTFTCNGRFLTSKANSSLSLEGAPGDDSLWTLTAVTASGAPKNCWYIKNKAGRSIEYYKEAFGSYSGTSEEYYIIFFKKQ